MTSLDTTLEGFQLSPQQVRLYELSAASTPASGEVWLKGPLDTEALRRAVDRVVERHEILRTAFRHLPGLALPLQVIRESAEVEWHYKDGNELVKEELADLEARWAVPPTFDVQEEPGLVLRCLRLAPESHRMWMFLPALCADRVALERLVEEIAAAYGGGEPEDEAIQYVDLSDWQNDLLESEETADARKHWMTPVEVGVEPKLPWRRAGAAVAGGTVVEGTLGESLLERLREVAGDVELKSILLAAWGGVLWRLAGGPGVVVGTAMDGRKYEEITKALGPFLRYLPVALRPQESVSWPAFVRSVETTLQEAHRWQEYFPGHQRLESTSPTSGFDFDSGSPAMEGGGLVFQPRNLRAASDRFELEMAVQRDVEGWCLQLHHDPAHYSHRSAALLLEAFQTLLEAMAENPEAAMAELSLLSPKQQRVLVEELNETGRELGSADGLFRRFTESALRVPERVAMSAEEGSLTYGELSRRVHRLARRLAGLRIGPETPVALLLERSPSQLIAILAVLEAGGAWVPLDPEQPAARLERILRRSEARLLVSESPLAPRLPRSEVRCLLLDDSEVGQKEGEPHGGVGGTHMAYQIFTSGSTGEPKGVMVAQEAIVNRVLWFLDSQGLEAEDRVVGRTPYIFDASIWETFAPLLAGAELVLARADSSGDPAYLVNLLRQRRITLMQCVPSLLEVLVQQPGFGECQSLARVFSGGEALSQPLVETFYATSGAALHNLYGPTETAIDATHFAVPQEFIDSSVAPIGAPIANLRVYVLNPSLASLAAGETGELWIGGTGLARGYAAASATTAAAFRPDPFGKELGGRLYRTGDLARHRGDGTLEFLGRGDHQIKLRGFRIELGDIEAALSRHKEVVQAVAQVRTDGPGGSAIVAYAVLTPESNLDSESLREALGEELPYYMVPAVVVPLEALPRTPGGKIDRRALPAPSYGEGERGAAPQGPIQEILASIYCDLLHLESIGVQESFFDLGGHSLLATQLLARLRDAFGVEMTLRSLFEQPTLASLAPVVEAALGMAGEAIPPLGLVPRDGDLPLSFGQQRLWFIERLQPGSAAYHIPSAVRLVGQLDLGLLHRTLAEVVRRHEVLRTRFPDHRGEPRQQIDPPRPLAIPRVDLTALPEERRSPLAEALLAADTLRAFDFEKGPLLRILVIRHSVEEHWVGLTLHHIVSDGWSATLLVREVAALYGAYVEGRPSPLPELSIQYADYAAWQRRWLVGAELDNRLDHWREQLAGAPAVLELPLDRPRAQARTQAAEFALRTLPKARAEALLAFGNRHGSTVFMVLLAALGAQLGRYARTRDVLLGSPIAGRSHTEMESLIGFFVNTLVSRARWRGETSFEDLVHQMREQAIEGHRHQDLPFEKLVDELDVDRRLETTPIFQVLFAFQNLPARALRLPGLRIEPVEQPGRRAKFDLTLVAMEVEAGIHLALEYKSELFDAQTADRLLLHYDHLLEAALAQPEQPVESLSLLTSEEREEVVSKWGGPRATGEEFLLHRRFAAVARREGQTTAVTFGEQHLTYAELVARSAGVARGLIALGVGPEVRVGLCFERSEDLVVALLGVLAAGGAYVPLDPQAPADRLRYILSDSAAAVVLTSSTASVGLGEKLAGGGTKVVDLVEFEGQGGAATELPEVPGLDPAHGAYVIYTSGSTGRPKGVVVTHGQVARLFTATEAWFGFGSSDVWTLFHSYAFDFSVWELWGALLYGGRLVVVPYLVSRSPRDFYALLAEEGVTMLSQTPSAFRQLVRVEEEVVKEGALPELVLRTVVFGGEALELEALRPWFRRHGDETPRLVNMYGITETTVHVTYRPVRAADLGKGNSPLGEGIPDLGVYVLDSRMEPVPEGIPGEIVVGGGGVARGYLRRPALTAERFVPDPFSGREGARLYRSGDLGRWRSGDLEYQGRMDHQVKVRGFRIEPGEIEACLLALEAVSAAAVVVREDTPGDARLVAYIVGAVDGPADPRALRDAAAESLPDYMVPAAFVEMDELPLTVNGKLDREALPAPVRGSYGGAHHAPPESDEEELLSAIWSAVLGIDEVGVEDNFFNLGGDSILSLQVQSRAAERGLIFELPDLFEHQTVRDLARVARRRDGGEVPTAVAEPFALVAPEDHQRLPEDAEDAYPLTLLQAGMLYHMELSPEEPPYHNVDSAFLRAPFDLETLRWALAEVTARHPVMRTSFHLTGFSEPLQCVHREVEPILGMEDLRDLDPAEQERVIDAFLHAEKRRLFDFKVPPQLRFFVHRRTDDHFQLTFVENHAIFDGWSLHTTLGEIFEVYFARLAGEEVVKPPEPGFTFRDFVALEVAARNDSESIAWWRSRLAGLTVTRPPHWGQPEAPASQRLGVVSAEIFPALSDRLKAVARRAAVPIKSVLLAAHLKMLSLLSGERDVVTGFTTHGRPEGPGAESVRGLFLNTLPFRLEIPAGSWLDLVEATFAEEREMLPHRLYPAPALRKARGGEEIFEVAFNYVHFHVVADLVQSENLEVLDFRRAEGTNFVLLAGFSQNLVTGRVGLQLEYDAQAYERSQIEAFSQRYTRLLSVLAEDPEATHDRAAVLTAAESHQVMVEWNDTGDPAGILEFCLHQGIVRQALATPGAPALIFGTEALTYEELLSRAQTLAWELARQGVAVDDVVAVLAERSVEMVVALLGVLLAGAAYLPLDPELPKERLAFMVKESGARRLLFQPALEERLPEIAAERLPLASGGGPAVRGIDDGPPVEPGPENLAYVIYTSGSTGRPKGAMNSHRAIVNRLLWMQRRFLLDASDRVLQKTPYGFDVSVWEFFWPLLNGACLVVAPPGVHRDPEALASEIRSHGVTTVHFVPSMLQLFVATPGARECGGLRRVIASGEALPTDLVQRFREVLDVRLENLYGPTEAAVDVSFYDTAGPLAESVPIGRPIDHLSLHLLDRGLRPVPVGAPGELLIGGVGLARGYRRRPALTAERFIPHPGGTEPGARLYRTGDLARWLPEGKVDFLGRVDHQIKLRGFRIELGEIEAALAQHPAVREAVVILDRTGAGRLVAYFVARDEALPAAEELRTFLARRLAEYMVPTRFMELEAMPLLPNGKLDRRALPAPPEERPELERSYVAPRNRTEEVLAATWGEVLGVEQVGVHDDFFALGGDSIRSIQAVAEARDQGLLYRLVDLLDHPTVARLAERAEWGLPEAREMSHHQPFDLVAEEDRGSLPEGLEDAYPLAALQAGMLFHSQLEPESAIYHDVVSYHLAVPFDEAAVRKALGHVVARHPVLRTSFEMVKFSEPLQLVHLEVDPPVTVEDLTGRTSEEEEGRVLGWIAEEKHQAFDWRQPPLFRVHLQRRADDTFQFGFSFHHAILDGWSLASMLTELFQLYLTLVGRQAEVRGVEALPEVAFRDFIALEQEARWAESTKEFWRGQVEGLEPTRMPRLRGRERRMGEVEALDVELSPKVAGGLVPAAREAGVPLKSLLLAVHVRALALATGRGEAVTGLVMNGRPETRGSDRVLGLFLNSLPFRLATRRDSWRGLARAAFGLERDITPHRRYPMADLQRVFGEQPLFETAFNFTHFHVLETVGELDGVDVLGSRAFEQTNFTLLAGFRQNLVDGQAGLTLTWDADELTTAQVQVVAAIYRRLLVEAAEDVNAAPGTAAALSLGQRHQLLVEWNDTGYGRTEGVAVSRRFAEVVDARPDAVALVDGEGQISYAALEARAGRLARRLGEAGVGPEIPVGLMMGRSAELVVAILATLKAGGAYLPLDPSHPPERLDWMLSDAGARVVICDSDAESWAEEARPELEAICLGREREALAKLEAYPLRSVSSAGLAYLMYTSGSTGLPKGTATTHHGILRLVDDPGFARFSAEDTSLMLAPASFDASTLELWGALLNGGRLAIFPPQAPSLDDVAKTLAQHRVSTLWLTAGLFQQMVDHRIEAFAPLDQLLAGGDALSPPHVEKVLEIWPELTMINGYGPTEGTTFTCCHAMRGARSLSTVPIGGPIAETEVRVLGADGEPVVVGAVGELLIGGAGLARGYWGRPALTAEKFLPAPSPSRPGDRLYRSGDLVRFRPDGLLEILGRLDQQVKIRGFRIEPGEIETVLSEQPGVGAAVVVVRSGKDGDKRLAGYVAAEDSGEERISAEEILVQVRSRLPEYMVPTTLQVLDALPLTVNGKVDRRALPDPETLVFEEREHVPPETAAEILVCGILEEMLGESPVGLRDDFFELGGHSLVATRVVARLHDVFQVEFPLRALFEMPSAEGILDELARLSGGRDVVEEISVIYEQVSGLSDEEVQELLS